MGTETLEKRREEGRVTRKKEITEVSIHGRKIAVFSQLPRKKTTPNGKEQKEGR